MIISYDGYEYEVDRKRFEADGLKCFVRGSGFGEWRKLTYVQYRGVDGLSLYSSRIFHGLPNGALVATRISLSLDAG